MAADLVFGWDIGGAHVKVARLTDGAVSGVMQLPCPLWQGLDRLDAALAEVRATWPEMATPGARHAATMTGELADLFEHREAGVAAISAHLVDALGPGLRLFCGSGLAGDGASQWCRADAAQAHWLAIASANWMASAALVARRCGDAVLVDIGSTTTDLAPVSQGRICAAGADDAGRLRSGALVYQGVVRTALMALTPRIRFGDADYNVMNEFFATTADVYRLTGELAASHDQYPAADGGDKCADGTRRRLARMIGLDARDADDAAWLAFAQAWRSAQLERLAENLDRLLAALVPPPDAPSALPLVAAGCGAFLVAELAARRGCRSQRFSELLPITPDPAVAEWADVCAPALAVAWLAREDAAHD